MNHEIKRIVQSFGEVADDYDRGRPGYSPEAIDFLTREFSITSQTNVLDVGAGTGKLTAQILSTGADVAALEPVEGMRRRLEENLPDVRIVGGSAESIMLANESIDIIVCGQSFHWFHTEKALRDFYRVLRPGGGLALLWNHREVSAGWTEEVTRIMDRHEPAARQLDASTTWPNDFERVGLFSPLQKQQFEHSQVVDLKTLLAAVKSRSYIASLNEPDQRRVLDEVLELVETHPDLKDRDVFELPYITDLYWSRAVVQRES
ncbi:MAG: class I SAM-dependent methyltransferase [Actinobacteria bacterium]|nr:class I SAM-dependent methyltransferase [Actinomycetota bacterium]